MSPKGTQPVNEVSGSQAVLNPCPLRPCKICSPNWTQAAPPTCAMAPATDAFSLERGKRFIMEELTKGQGGRFPQGTPPLPTVKGLLGVCPAARAALKLATMRSPRIVLALIGWLR